MHGFVVCVGELIEGGNRALSIHPFSHPTIHPICHPSIHFAIHPSIFTSTPQFAGLVVAVRHGLFTKKGLDVVLRGKEKGVSWVGVGVGACVWIRKEKGVSGG